MVSVGFTGRSGGPSILGPGGVMSVPFPGAPAGGFSLPSSRRLGRFLLGPLQGVVGYLLPTILPYRVVRASGELMVVGHRTGVAVVLEVGLVDCCWLEMIL